nr:hypothetical protein [Tanacetum cinerariifolium]
MSRSVPAVVSRSVPAVESRSVPAVEPISVPTVESRSVPAVESRSVPIVESRSVPAVESRSVTVVESRSIPAIESRSITPGNSQINIDDKGYWDSGCSRHMTGNISYLTDYEPYDGGYVSFGQGGCNITECIVLGRNFKLSDDANVLLRTPRQHNMYTIDLNNVVPHKDLTCLVAKASADESMLWDRRLGHLNFKTMNREFSNARTPQQNGVAERRNRTLIEAAKTMLADAKLPVTFWAEAVNTACYVQNRVLVNKSQNKTPYELFNGRLPAIGFLKPFGCHVMILNTLDNFRKFEAKGDEGHFIGYSMSSKAFRVFKKRTKRVEENLHVDFLENKPIEKGTGPNWLFDIDSLTNSMNYVPVVVAGTNSTNFSGTKEAAGQDVKKDVSPLRYIVLPNWFHEAHLESSTSNAQDTCSANAPESSGNSNPTATSTNPSADHMETLAVEIQILTVSSLVPTACLNDSPEPSSDTRLISKKVTSQDDTPSLDNILTLTNRFEDILRVTTNTDDTNGVEADLGNMETTITASFTPTLRIHKDHPKSQIIGPVETPIQTRNKSKEMEEQSFIATIHQKTNPALLQFCLFSCFLSQEEPKKISNALQDPSWAPRAWYGTLSKYFLTNGFQRGTIDQTLFIRRNRGDFILVQVYVDDIIFKSSNPQLCKEFEALMHEKFQMSAMGELNFFLGLQVLQKKDGIFLSQDKYVGDILNKFGYSDTIVATSTTEAEYVTAASCCGQVLWIQNQLLDYGEVPIKPIYPLCNPNNTVIMARLAFCDYHNMIAILEKYEQNSDFHPIVDFVEASHIRYALTFNPTVHVSHIRHIWSTARIETTKEGTKILATVACLSPKSTGFNEFIATALVCLATNRVYNFSKMIFDGRTVPLFPSMLVTMGEGSGTPTKPHHTPTPEATPSPQHELSLSSLLPVTTESLPAVIPFDNPPLRQYTSRTRIAQSSVFPPVVDEPASPFGDDCQGEAFPTDSSFGANQDRANIAKTSPLPSDSTPRVTSLVDDKGRVGNHKFEGQVKLLEDREGGGIAQSEDDALIKGRREEAAERVSDDTEEMATVLTFMDAASILTTGGVQVVPTATEVATATVSIPTGSGVVSTTSPSIPTTAPIFTTATESTPYTRRKGKETMVESETPKKKIARDAEIARIHAEEKLQMLIDGLDRNNETVAKYLQEYHQFAAELPIERRIELIMLKSHAGWKARHFKGMTLEEIKEKFDPVWKQFQDFIPIGFKEEAERFKRKGVRLEQDSFKKLKTSEEVPEEKLKEMMELIPVEEVYVEALQVKHPIIDWDVHTEGERSYWKIIRLGGSSASYHFFVDLLKHLDREDLNQLWALVKETLNIIPATNNKEKEI